MGFNDAETVALIGAHAVGRCHTDRSGHWGPWTNAETTFSNEYFRLLLGNIPLYYLEASDMWRQMNVPLYIRCR